MKISLPKDPTSARVAVMLHGWTGDENSMWVFTNQLDEDWLLISPRAPYPSRGTSLGGFSWVDQRIDHWPLYTDFLASVEVLHIDLLELSRNFPDLDFSKLSIIGFSQGAAMGFVYSMVHSDRVKKLGLLAGFLPDNSEGYFQKRAGQPLDIFIGHGSLDNIVPVEKAYEGIELLRSAGLKPRSCITDVKHQLGSDCFKALTSFLNQE